MGKAKNWFWSSIRNAWLLTGKGGTEIAELGDAGLRLASTGTLPAINVGSTLTLGGGTGLNKIGVVTGTILPLTSIGSGATAISTISGMSGITTGDKVFISPIAAIGGHTNLGVAFVPSTNTVNVWISNTKPDSAGSFVAVGADVLYVNT